MKYVMENPVKGSITGSQKFLSAIKWRNGILITDEPEKMGGQDLGPDPFTLLLSSLISCTLATLRMYIDYKGLSVSEITVEANLFNVIANEGVVVHIERRIDIPNLVDQDLQQRLLRVAENCPISKLLKGEVKIVSAFVTGAIQQ